VILESGSAPKYAVKNVINPLAAICAAGVMQDVPGDNRAAKRVEVVVIKTSRTRQTQKP